MINPEVKPPSHREKKLKGRGTLTRRGVYFKFWPYAGPLLGDLRYSERKREKTLVETAHHVTIEPTSEEPSAILTKSSVHYMRRLVVWCLQGASTLIPDDTHTS